MARYEGKMRSSGEAKLELEELLKMLDVPEKNPWSERRCSQLARFLSGEDSGESLRGAFADKGPGEGR